MTDSKTDLLHPTGRHPEGGCGCTGEPDDPPCEFHAPGNDGDELDVTPVDVPTDIDISVRRNMLLIERYKAEVRRLRDRIYSHDGVVECQRADEAEAEVDRLHTANNALRAAAWELLVTTECEVITVSEPGARERFEAAKLQLRNWFCKPAASTSDENPGKARIEADGGNATRPGDDWPSVEAIEHALSTVDAVCKHGAPEYPWAVACNLGAAVRRERLKTREYVIKYLDLNIELARLRADNERLDDQVDDLTEQLTEAKTKLARVDALRDTWRRSPSTWGTLAGDELEAALRDDQPIGP
jgi:hypothetical protein